MIPGTPVDITIFRPLAELARFIGSFGNAGMPARDLQEANAQEMIRSGELAAQAKQMAKGREL